MENSENNYREAVSLFCQLLKDAFSTPAKNSREARGQYIIALRHVASFCISMGDDNDLISQRFHRLALALFDVQFGSKPELFKGGAASEGRLADPSDVWHMRCRAALILELLVQTEMSEDDAAELIVKSCPNLKNATRESRDTKTSLIYWRKALTENKVQNPFAVESFADGVNFLNDLDLPSNQSKRDMATTLMKALDEQAGGREQ